MFEIPVGVQSIILDLLVLLVVKIVAPLAFLLFTMLIMKANSWFKAKLSQEQLSMAKMLAATAVQAAQQSGLAGIITNDAKSKKQFAVDYLTRELKNLGLGSIAKEVGSISALLESELNQGSHRLPEFVLIPKKKPNVVYSETK